MIEHWLARAALPFFAGTLAASCGGSSISHVEDRGAGAADGSGGAAVLGGSGGVSIGGAHTGGTAGRGEENCPDTLPADGVPCGGDLAGTWTSTACPLKVSGSVDLSRIGLSLECLYAPVLGSHRVTGTVTFNADDIYDQRYADDTVSSGQSSFELGPECLQISGTDTTCEALQEALSPVGFGSVTCASNMVSGGCTCTGTLLQNGGLGLISDEPSSSGNYSVTGHYVILAWLLENNQYAQLDYAYCVSPDAQRLALWVGRMAKTGWLTDPMVFEKR
jgi:hypothetical protein